MALTSHQDCVHNEAKETSAAEVKVLDTVFPNLDTALKPPNMGSCTVCEKRPNQRCL